MRQHSPPVGQFPGDLHLKFSAPVEVRSSYRGKLLSTVQPIDEQRHDDASHGLRGCVLQELHHMGILLYRRTAPWKI